MSYGKPSLVLTDSERKILEASSRGTSRHGLRARIILACATGLTNLAVARVLKVQNHTVGKWRNRFVDKRLNGLIDDPRSGRPRKHPRPATPAQVMVAPRPIIQPIAMGGGRPALPYVLYSAVL
jgi:hypothetical protein